MGHAVAHGLVQGATHVGQNPVLPVLGLDARGLLDGLHGRAHVRGVVGLQRGVTQALEGVDLAQVQVGVDEGRGDEIAPGVDLHRAGVGQVLGNGSDAAIRDGDVEERGVAPAQPRATDDEVIGSHGFPLTRAGR